MSCGSSSRDLYLWRGCAGLFTRSILTKGVPARVQRDERPLAYWFHVIFLATFGTLLLLGVPRWVFIMWGGISIVAFIVMMNADQRMSGRTTENPYRNLPRWTRFVAAPAGILVIIGLIGFLACFLANLGCLNWLPASFEWPVGHAHGAIAMPNGYYIVPLQGFSRIQVYDPNWRFVRGWFIQDGNGGFVLHPSRQDQFEVFTGALRHGGSRGYRYTFTLNGDLASPQDCSLDETTWNSIAKQGTSVVVPTSMWLWPFSNPGHAIILLVPGAFVLGLLQFLGWLAAPAKVTRQQTWVHVETRQHYR